jgi:hypothetical protein
MASKAYWLNSVFLKEWDLEEHENGVRNVEE